MKRKRFYAKGRSIYDRQAQWHLMRAGARHPELRCYDGRIHKLRPLALRDGEGGR